MAALMPQGKQQYFTAGGIPLVGGKVYTYAAGTTTPLATYTTAAADTPNANPVILDSRGEASIFFSAANYKIVVKDSLDSTIWTQDNLAGDAAASVLTSLALSTGSSLVGHIASGTGAVATTVQVKLRRVVFLEDFSIDTTGTTDSTTGFQACLNAVTDGGSIILPNSGYVKFSSVSTTKAVRLVGAGYTNKLQAIFGASGWTDRANFKGCVLISTATSGNAIQLGVASENNTLQLCDFMLVGPGSGTSTGIELLRSVGNNVSNVLVANFARGWSLDQCQDGLYSHIVSKGNKTGINLAGTITSGQNTFIQPEIQSFDTYGMNISVASMVKIYGGLVQDGRGGVGINCQTTSSSKNTIHGVWFENADVAGAHPTAAIALYGARNAVVDCYFADPYDTILVSGAGADRNKIINNHFGSINTAITVAAGATNTLVQDSEPASGGTISDSGTNTIRISTDNGAVSQKIGNASWVGTASFGGVATAAGTDTKILKKKTGLADAAFTSLASVNVPNSAISASLKIRVTGSLGAGGAIGANESSATIECDVTIARTAGLTCVVTQSANYGTAEAAVAGAATCTVAIDSSLISGAAGATQTITLRVAVTRGSGASTNHTATASIECLNANDSGVLVY